ncbi:hypothetical protein LCGC14_2175620 [marine sediment metagenome]|uniref:Uncharacterized protein n=1 Tax=marine sediment metagenome TaxID=412755 RepID=A0A0F9DNU9_9ZZZZ
MKEKNGKQDVDIAVLGERVDNVIEKLDDVINNHIPHIKADIIDLKLKIAYWSGGVGIIIILTQIILKFYA